MSRLGQAALAVGGAFTLGAMLFADAPRPAVAPAAPAAGPAAGVEANASGPRIAVEPSGFDFGRVLGGRSVNREFAIKNVGNADLVIEQVSTSCGCTAALLDHKTVKPGASAALRVTLQTPNVPGRVVKSVLVRSNDASRNVTELKVEANVVAAEATR